MTITARFDDFEFQKYHTDDMTIYAFILTIFGNQKATLSFVFALQLLLLQI